MVLMVLVQLLWPAGTLRPYTVIDGRDVGGKTKGEVITMLNKAYSQQKVAIYLGASKKPVVQPSLADIDAKVDNTQRITNVEYPWFIRIIPTSLFWAGRDVAAVPTPTFGKEFTTYVTKSIMPDCQHEPVNATLKLDGSTLQLVPEETGGTCKVEDVEKSLKAIKPVLTTPTDVKVARAEKAPQIRDATATALAKTLNNHLAKGVSLTVLNETVAIDAKTVMGWLDFAAEDTKLVAKVNTDRAGAWMNEHVAGKVNVKAGVSYVKTYNMAEVSRQNGATGRGVNVPQTVAQLQAVVDGGATTATLITRAIAPSTQYTRSYSADDSGLSALMANYAKDHPGTFGVSFMELDGKRRRASYNGDKQFVTASTYKLFVAYSVMKQIDAGTRSWPATQDCFNKMISYSDNDCAHMFLDSVGVAKVTKDIQDAGLKNSTFMKKDNIYSTPNDEVLMLGMIATGQNFSSDNQARLIAAMKANVYRKGIPAGVNGTVADKVGFLWGLLHDAAIVYGPNGTYVLTIMTDGSSWGAIADLAKQIDQLHAQ